MVNPVFKTTSGGTTGTGTGRRGYTRELKAGEYVFREGELGTEMYIINEGKVEILNQVGDEEQLLAVLEKGDFFGEMSVLEDLPRAASARALTDVRLLQINGSTFDQLLQGNPEIAVRMMRKLSRRLRETDEMLKSVMGTKVTSREMPRPVVQTASEGPERLVHVPSGMEFHLSNGSETTIGRKDPVTGIYPDVDLTPVDSQRSVSRRHAKIYRRGSKYFFGEEIGTMNSTFLNGKRLETGIPAEIRAGDELRCGVVVLRFEGP
ncbi:MAG TPA: cyclic nucleotide-binding domain-containing protein [Thermoanaerobaculia bacterium]|jgi:CRP-like cAMP-binding protein